MLGKPSYSTLPSSIIANRLALNIPSLSRSGYLLLTFLIFLSAHPPLIGYGTLQTLAGFTFGFWPGMMVGYAGALAGGVTCFMVCRVWFGGYVRRIVEKYPSLEAVVRAVEKKGLKVGLLPFFFFLLRGEATFLRGVMTISC